MRRRRLPTVKSGWNFRPVRKTTEVDAMDGKRNEYIVKMNAKIKKWNAEDDKQQVEANKFKADTLVRCRKQFGGLDAEHRVPGKKASELKKARKAAWEDVKVGVDIVRRAMVESIKTAKSCSNQLAARPETERG